jgi:hypothetical protein
MEMRLALRQVPNLLSCIPAAQPCRASPAGFSFLFLTNDNIYEGFLTNNPTARDTGGVCLGEV